MKQILLRKGVVVDEVPVPGFGAGQVLVEAAYSFISTGTEMAGVKSSAAGLAGRIIEQPRRIAQVLEMIRVNGVRRTLVRVGSKLHASRPCGYSCSGRVIGVGRAVRDLAVGDLVACAGAGYANHAEVVAVPSNLVAKLPPGCDLRAASCTTIAAIALQGVRRADLRLGETAAVVGLGLLGQITLQMLRACGVRPIGFDPDGQRVQEARMLGYEKCFALTGEDAVAKALDHTAGLGVDAAIITAATPAAGICQDAMEMARRKGKVVVVGDVPLTFDRSPFYAKEIDFLISCSYGPGRYDPSYEEGGQDYPYAYVRWTERRNMQAVLQMIADGLLRCDPLIAAEYPAAQAQEAFARLAAPEGPRPLGVVLKYDLPPQTPPDKLVTSIPSSAPAAIKGRIGVGVIGTGSFFIDTHLPNFLLLADKYRIVSLCNRSGPRAADVARQVGGAQVCSDAGDLLNNKDVQLVMISTRHDTHADLAVRALAAGKHVFAEKPMAMDDSQLAGLLEAIRKGKRCYVVGFNRRFSPHARRLRSLLEDRVSPLVVNYRVLPGRPPRDNWVYTEAGGGRAIGEACHMLDLFGFLVGDAVGVAEVAVTAPPPDAGGPPGDTFVAAVRYEDGSLCTLTYAAMGGANRATGKERIEAMWDGKTYVIEDFVRGYGVGCSAGRAGAGKSKGHYEELSLLADHLAGRGPAPISVDACVKATELSFIVDRACRQEPLPEAKPSAPQSP
jgi:predicted dehydrogenase/threonine dehydrogenase-like Zn-dependent dehydrogenase